MDATSHEPQAAAQDLPTALTKTYASHYRELLEGVPRGQPSWVTTGGTEGGLHGTLEGVSAAEASRDVNGTTLAAHVEHLRWAMQLVNDYYGGKEAPPDWSESWSVTTVDEESWRSLREALRTTGETLLTHLSTPVEWDQEMGRMALLASYGHTAYHLGAIRQLAKAVKVG